MTHLVRKYLHLTHISMSGDKVFNRLPVHNKMHPHIRKPKLGHEI